MIFPSGVHATAMRAEGNVLAPTRVKREWSLSAATHMEAALSLRTARRESPSPVTEGRL